MSRYVSRDGLMSSADPDAVALWDDICARAAAAEADWNAKLRAAGVKLAHPDDGWVDRARNTFNLSWYPGFNDWPEAGDLIAFGSPPEPTRWDPPGESWYQPNRVWDGHEHGKAIREPESACSGYRICRVTKVDDRTGILGRLVTYHYEDTGVRMPPRQPERSVVQRLLRRRSS